MSDHTQYINLTKDNFETEVLNSKIPVLVDFFAPWCGPCRVMNPIVTELATKLEGVVKVAKLNIDDDPELASQYQIEAIPTLIFFNQGEVVEKNAGIVSKQVLLDTANGLIKESVAA
ncbi:MAG: thioredoxin [Moorea sp. SIO2B7]|nr:thioredoxin [Moorena sp. SIO2B7]